MKRLLLFLLILTLGFTSIGGNSVSAGGLNDIKAKYAILMDYDTGQILYEKNSNEKLYPASTTKIWTAYMVLKHCPDLDKKIKIENLPQIEGTSMYLKNGEEFTIRELLTSLMVNSSNDVAFVLGRYVGGGDLRKFIDMMNEEAKKAGAINTHFNNPHGLPDEKHTTTARDMVVLARVAMRDPIFRGLCKTKVAKFKGNKANPIERIEVNSNKFLTSKDMISYNGKDVPLKYDIVDGIKTGYTDDAGNCLVSTAQKDNHRLIAGVFKAPAGHLYMDSRILLDYGFNNFTFHKVLKKEDFTGKKRIPFTHERELFYEPVSDFSEVVKKGSDKEAGKYDTKLVFNNISLPIKKGQKVGDLEITLNGKPVTNIEVVALNSVNSILNFIPIKYASTNPKNVLIVIGCVLLILLLILLYILFRIRRFFRNKAKARQARKAKNKIKMK